VAQVKKQEVREAILFGAHTLFQQKGYTSTSVAEIAQAAGVSPSNIYVYFDSKFAILYAVYVPWLRARFLRLEEDLAPIEDHEVRLRFILRTVWHDIPSEDNGFANNLMQALSTATSEEGYSRDLLRWVEDRLSAMIRDCLPPARAALTDQALLAHVIFMAFDGFAMNHRLRGPSPRIDAIIDLMISLLLDRQPSRSDE